MTVKRKPVADRIPAPEPGHNNASTEVMGERLLNP